MIKCNVSNVAIEITETETLTAGRVGLECQFTFSSEWDGLAKVAYFLGSTTSGVVITEDTVTVPAGPLAEAGYKFYVGVVGKNAAGDVVIPTLWAKVGKIQRSAAEGDESQPEPDPDVVAQIQLMAMDAVEKATYAKGVIDDNLEAITEAGETQTEAVNTEGSTQVLAIQTESSTQQAAIAAAAAAARDSIPEDYTALSDDVDDVKSAITAINGNFYDGELPLTLTIGAGVNPSTGGNYNSQPTLARVSSVEIPSRGVLTWVMDNDEYEIMPWCYSSTSAASATGSPTNGLYVSSEVNISWSADNRTTRVSIRRKDGGAMTSGAADPASDESKISRSLHAYYSNYADKQSRFAEINQIAKAGGVTHPVLRAGGLNFNGLNGAAQESFHASNSSTYLDLPIFLAVGDVISFGTLTANISQVTKDADGYKRANGWTGIQGDFIAQESGLYNFVVSKSGSVVLPGDAEQEITIAYREKAVANLPKNPYKHIAKAKTDDGYVWSSALFDVKSTCHLHTAKALYFTRARLAGYDHIAVSNYHASKPTVPMSEIIQSLEGFDASRDTIPETWLENPNAEHVYFTDADSYVGSSAGSHLHLCSVGSYVTSGADNTGVGEGGFDGTVMDFASAFEALRQFPNGGGITINHPVWSGIDAAGILRLLTVPNVFALEIYNANCEHANGKGFALDLWDEVLSTGVQIFGTAVPDHETEGAFWNDHLPLGFIHLLCVTKSEQEIMLAYRNGRFYTTTGNDTLLLKMFDVDDNGLVTFKSTDTGTIKFVTAKRQVTVENNNVATFQSESGDVFVRAEIETEANRLFTNAIML